MSRLLSITCIAILIWIIGNLLIVGRGFLIPLVMAVFVWYLLNTIYTATRKLPYIRDFLPNWVARLLSLVLVMAALMVLANIITNNVSDVIDASARYQENLLRIYNFLDERYHIRALGGFDSLIKMVNIQDLLIAFYAVFKSIMSSAVLIIIYVLFLFVEQLYFNQKLKAIFIQKKHRDVVDSILEQIVKDTQTYLGLKTLISLMTAFSSFVIMKWVGLDFAEFWALLIFFLNFVPNIGAIIATMFPALLALIQFQTLLPFMFITSGLVTVQLIIGNFIEPKFLSKSLNLSPFVILITLALWGSIWGVIGMFLSIPLTVMMMIVFSHFKATRPVAIMLSQDGYIKHNYSAMNKPL